MSDEGSLKRRNQQHWKNLELELLMPLKEKLGIDGKIETDEANETQALARSSKTTIKVYLEHESAVEVDIEMESRLVDAMDVEDEVDEKKDCSSDVKSLVDDSLLVLALRRHLSSKKGKIVLLHNLLHPTSGSQILGHLLVVSVLGEEKSLKRAHFLRWQKKSKALQLVSHSEIECVDELSLHRESIGERDFEIRKKKKKRKKGSL